MSIILYSLLSYLLPYLSILFTKKYKNEIKFRFITLSTLEKIIHIYTQLADIETLSNVQIFTLPSDVLDILGAQNF